MKRALIAALIWLVWSPGWGQPAELERAARLLGEGYALMSQSTPETDKQALEKWEAALALCQELGDLRAQADVWMAIGVLHYTRSESQASEEAYRQALELARSSEDRAREALALKSVADVKVQQSQLDEAGELYVMALDRQRNADVLFSYARLMALRGDTDKAIELYQECLQKLPEENQAITLTMVGRLYQKRGEYEGARSSFEKAIRLQEAAQDKTGRVLSLYDLASLEAAAGRHRVAIELYQTALSCEPAAPQQFTLQIGLSMAYTQLSEMKFALRHTRAALQAAELSGNQELVTRGHIHMAATLSAMGENQKALTHLEQALQTPNPELRAHALRSLGSIEIDLGAYQRANDHFDEALRLSKEHQLNFLLAPLHESKSRLYSLNGHFNLAIANLEKALEITESTQDVAYRAHLYEELARNWLRWSQENDELAREKADRAEAALDEGTRLYRRMGDPEGELQMKLWALLITVRYAPEGSAAAARADQALLQLASEAEEKGSEVVAQELDLLLAQTAFRDKKYNLALDHFAKIHQREKARGGALQVASAAYNVGRTYFELDQLSQAQEFFSETYRLYRQGRHTRGEADAANLLSQTAYYQEDFETAQKWNTEAIRLLEAVRGQLTESQAKADYYSLFRRIYRWQVQLNLLLSQRFADPHFADDAFEQLEQSKARGLLDVLEQADARASLKVDPELVRRERLVLAELEKAQASDSPGGDGELRALEMRLQDVRSEIRRRHPKYAELTLPEPLTLERLQTDLLDPDTLLLEYFVSDIGVHRWEITKESVNLHYVEFDQASRRRFYSYLRAVRRRVVDPEGAEELSRLLLPSQILKRRVVIVPDGLLHLLPMAALTHQGEPLAARHEVVYAPSASVLRGLRHRQKSHAYEKRLALFADPVFEAGDPRLETSGDDAAPLPELTQLALSRSGIDKFVRLPGSRNEAQEIRKTVGGANRVVLKTDFEASKKAVLEEVDRHGFEVVHFATHGVCTPGQPELSGIVLSLFDQNGQPQSGYLRLNDIFQLRLGTELVVLSACQTGLGQVIEGEGVVGLTRAFMYAGSPRLLVSQWNVDDEATAALMTSFYRHLYQSELTPGEALRRAQMQVRENPKWRSPYYWAAFQLQGDWQSFTGEAATRRKL